MPKISVIMGVYHEKPEYIRQAINSICLQTYTDFEFIIVLDDPDNIKALKILKDYESKDRRIRVLINKKNIGLAMSLNKAISVANGEYLARMDADDISMPDRFAKQVMFLNMHPDITVLGTNINTIDENGHTISDGKHILASTKNLQSALYYTNVIPHPSVMMRRNDILKLGGYRDFPAAQDYDLWLRILTSGMNICILNEHLLNYRINPHGISRRMPFIQALSDVYIRQLAKERTKTNYDSFSVEHLEKYLTEHKAYDKGSEGQFLAARSVLGVGVAQFKQKHYFSSVIHLAKAAAMNSIVRIQIQNMCISFLLKHIPVCFISYITSQHRKNRYERLITSDPYKSC